MSNIIKQLELSNSNSIIHITLNKGEVQAREDIANNIDKEQIIHYTHSDLIMHLDSLYNVYMELMTNYLDIVVNAKEDSNKKIYLITENNGKEERLSIYDLYHLILLSSNKNNSIKDWKYSFDNINIRMTEQRDINGTLDKIAFYFEL